MERDAAFVTGGTGALGRAVTKRFLDDGYRVAVTYRRREEWSALESEHPGPAREGTLLGLECDVTREEQVGGAIEATVERFGGLRVLLHVAGGYRGGQPVESLEERGLRGMLELNLVSAFLAAKHAIPHLKRGEGGRLLFISSRGAVETYPGASAYAAAKLGLHALVQTLAKELKKSGITANAVLPSMIDTPANRASMPDADFSAWVPPAAVAGLLAFLASRGADQTSGALVPIYGRA
ncbi:MAG TPA: SDR family NAD(P)-dependent oxidoreductase [Candidatus Saccharimonadales bacterium]|nr:SDR family NAD(P)-dependent oxidoreductase [Candidatus Saccharimonadales bacterium]